MLALMQNILDLVQRRSAFFHRDLKMFNWDDLKFFLALCRKSKLIRAAETLRVDHTTVSRRVAALESALGTKLVEKTELGYRPTDAGEKLIPIAEQIENSALYLEDDIGGGGSQLSGPVRVGSPDGFGSFFLAPNLPKLISKHPGLEIDLVAVPRYVSLSRREADISVTLGRPTTGRLYARKLTDYHLQLFASREYLDQVGPVSKRRELRNHSLVGYIEDLIFAPELRYMEVVGKDLTARFRSTSLVAQRQAILSGAGIGVLPRFIAHDDKRLVPVLANDFRLVKTFWLLMHEDIRGIARVRETADFIAECVKSQKSVFLNC